MENSNISSKSVLESKNTRKRKLVADDKDIENQKPAKRRATRSSAFAPTLKEENIINLKDNTSSSDIQGSLNLADNDIYNLPSPTTLSNIVLSPCETSNGSWNTLTPHNIKISSSKNKSHLSSISCCVTPSSDFRLCPLPALSWAESSDVWKLMCRKDERASLEREPNMFDNHPGLQSRMRAILLDWLIEVCEVYKLHRETYYLAIDYIDRYLSKKKSLPKTHLQLLGITALFIAAKVEEIYPPKIGEFAYVTDGACTEDDILKQELLILSELQWSINPVTIICWLSLYMQINITNRQPEMLKLKQISSVQKIFAEIKTSDAFIYPQFSGFEFSQTAQLLDLCSLDIELTNYPYSVVAASALSHTFDRKTATDVSGLGWDILSPCAKWMESYFLIICEDSGQLNMLEQNEQIQCSYGLTHLCANIVTDNSHIIQTHTTSLEMFDRAILRRENLETVSTLILQEASPAPISLDPEGLLTPPASSRKSTENLELDEKQNNEKSC